MSKRYAVVVTGELKPGASREQARQVLTQTYKLPAAQADTLLGGKRVVVKRGVDRESGLALAKRFLAAGMVCGLAELRAPEPADLPPPLPPPLSPEDAPVAAEQERHGHEDEWPPPQAPTVPDPFDDDDEWPPKPRRDQATPPATAGDPAEVVPQVLSRFGVNKGAYPFDDVPDKILQNALKACFLTGEEPIHGVLDVSSGHNGKECLVFGQDGVTYRTAGKKRGFIPYDEFITAPVTAPNKQTLVVNHEHMITMMFTLMKPPEAVILIQTLQDALKNGLQAKPGEDLRRFRNRPGDLEGAVAFVMEPYLDRQRTHVVPDIPPKREMEARNAGYVPRDEACLALISLKVMGKYDKYLMVTNKGLHYRQNMSKRGFIPFSDLPNHEFTRAGIGLINLGDRGELDITGAHFKWWQLCALLGALQDIALVHVLHREPFKEPEERRMQCPLCGSANLGLSTKNKLSYTWGFVGYFLSAPITTVGGQALVAKQMAEAFGKTVYYMACRHCGNSWVDRTHAAAGEKDE